MSRLKGDYCLKMINYYDCSGIPLTPDLFLNPPNICRGMPFWAWNGHLTPERLTGQIPIFAEMGFGGAYMHVRTGLDVPYLGKEHMDCIKACVGTFRKQKLCGCLYDEDRYPSGAAGGLVTREDRFRETRLVFSANKKENAKLLAKYSVVLDCSGYLISFRRFAEGEAETGDVRYAYQTYSEKSPWFNNQSYIDVLNKDAVDRFIEVTHEAYYRAVGDEFGKSIPAIFTDEAHYLLRTHLAFSDSREEISLPWTDGLDADFESEYGYSLLDRLPVLICEPSDAAQLYVRYDYQKYITDRFTKNFFDNCGSWCEDHGLMFVGHVRNEDSLSAQTIAVGDAMRCYKKFAIPGVDMLFTRHEYSTVKQGQSAAHQLGKNGLLCELYGVTNWDFDFRGHKYQGDWQAALGVTHRVPHHTWYTMGGEAKRDCPGPIGYQASWYRQYSQVENHFARLSLILSRGKRQPRIGVINPIESFWLLWGPMDKTAAARERMESEFAALHEWLLFGFLDFDLISEGLMAELPCSADKGFRVGEAVYDCILVPGCLTLRSETVEMLENFRKNGGRLIFAGTVPDRVDGIMSCRVMALAESCERIPFEKVAMRSILAGYHDIVAYNSNGEPTEDILCQRRHDAGSDWLFMTKGREQNFRPDVPSPENVTVYVDGFFRPVCYDTISGECELPIPFSHSDGKTVFGLTFYEHDSVLLRLYPTAQMPPLTAAPAAALVPAAQIPYTCTYTLSEPNVLLLDMAEYSYDGLDFEPTEEILRIDKQFRLRAGFPYENGIMPEPWTEPDGNLQFIFLRFTFDCDLPFEGTHLGIEHCDMTSIVLNGEPVHASPDGYYVDRSIFTVPLPRLRKGKNVLLLCCPFSQRITLENCFILGNFGVELNGRDKRLTVLPEKLSFTDLCRQGFPFYGGNITYHIEPKLPEGDYALFVSSYRGALVDVGMDGRHVGSVWRSPYRQDLRWESGNKTLDLTLYGNRNNTFGQLHLVYTDDWHIGYRSEEAEWSYEYILRPMGILKTPDVFGIASPDVKN